MVQFDMAEISPAWKGKTDVRFFLLFVFVGLKPYIPCIIGFPVEAIEFTPMHTKSPKPVFAV